VSEPASQTRAKVAHAFPGRLRVRIDTPPGQGKLGHLAEELARMPDTQEVYANHTARSVTVTYDPSQVSAPDLLDRLHQLGLIVLDLADPTSGRRCWRQRLFHSPRTPPPFPVG